MSVLLRGRRALGVSCNYLYFSRELRMTHKVFSIYDSKAKAWLPPFFCPNAAVAIRMFERAVNDSASDFSRFSSDYTLFEVGEWSEHDGDLLNYTAKVNLGVAVEFVKTPGGA